MTRLAAASNRRVTPKPNSSTGRLSRFKSRFPRLLRTDFWRSSRSRGGFWASLFHTGQARRRSGRRIAVWADADGPAGRGIGNSRPAQRRGHR